jgi:hypothetical protein
LLDANWDTVARLAGGIRNWNSIFRQFRRWADSGIRDVILEGLAGSALSDATLQMIDATIIRAHHCAAGGKGARAQRARPFARRLLDQDQRPNQLADRRRDNAGASATPFPALMQQIDCDPDQMLGDKGYDSAAVRDEIQQRGGEAESPAPRPGKYSIPSIRPSMHCETASSASSIVRRIHAASLRVTIS